MCVCHCVTAKAPCGLGFGSQNTNGRQLRPVALVWVNERDEGRVSTEEGVRGTIRGVRMEGRSVREG